MRWMFLVSFLVASTGWTSTYFLDERDPRVPVLDRVHNGADPRAELQNLLNQEGVDELKGCVKKKTCTEERPGGDGKKVCEEIEVCIST